MLMAQQSHTEPEAVSEAIDDLLDALRMNGQICGREWPIAVTAAGYVATALLPDEDALDAAHHNKYVRMSLQKLAQIGLGEPEFTVFEDLQGASACPCSQPQSYILYTNYILLESPLRCGDCFRPVPLYRIPPTYDDEYFNIVCWQSEYQACDRLHMNSATLERAATRQMSRLDSMLTQQGLEACRIIQEVTQIPAYYYLYRYHGRSLRQERLRLCPSCGGEWLLPEKWHKFHFKCDRCRLVSNIANSVQRYGVD